jgi:anti-sigma-K factor RskA
MKQDDKLSSLLKQWHDIEPRANFEANVRRRIRSAQAPEADRISVIEFWRRLLWQHALATAAVVAASVIVGTSAGVFSVSRSAEHAHADFGFLSHGTLAGSYLKLASEDGR